MNEESDKSNKADDNAVSARKTTESPSGQEQTPGSSEASSSTNNSKRMSSDSYETSRPENTPPIREHKVQLARQKIEEGTYDSPEILDAIVEKLVDALTG